MGGLQVLDEGPLLLGTVSAVLGQPGYIKRQKVDNATSPPPCANVR